MREAQPLSGFSPSFARSAFASAISVSCSLAGADSFAFFGCEQNRESNDSAGVFLC